MGPLQENSDPNPRSCWFLREGYPGPQCTRGPHRPPPLPWANPSYVPAPRPCVYSLRVPHFAKKRKVLLPRSFLTHFYTLITMSLTEIQNSKKNERHFHLKILKYNGRTKKKVRQFRKNGSNRRQMTQGFQIWSQNSNQTTFDQVIGQKRLNSQEIGKFPRFLKILTFYCQ